MWIFIALLFVIDIVLVILIIEIRAELRELKAGHKDLLNSHISQVTDNNVKYASLEQRLAIVDNKLRHS